MNKLFVDSSFIIPLFKKNDSNKEIVYNNKNILSEDECYISNGIMHEIITVVMMKTKNIELTKKAYYFLNDNFIVINEFEIEKYTDKVFSIFKKYNKNSYKASFIDCSSVIIANNYNLDYVVSLDKFFRKFDEINCLNLD